MHLKVLNKFQLGQTTYFQVEFYNTIFHNVFSGSAIPNVKLSLSQNGNFVSQATNNDGLATFNNVKLSKDYLIAESDQEVSFVPNLSNIEVPSYEKLLWHVFDGKFFRD